MRDPYAPSSIGYHPLERQAGQAPHSAQSAGAGVGAGAGAGAMGGSLTLGAMPNGRGSPPEYWKVRSHTNG